MTLKEDAKQVRPGEKWFDWVLAACVVLEVVWGAVCVTAVVTGIVWLWGHL